MIEGLLFIGVIVLAVPLIVAALYVALWPRVDASFEERGRR